jgi:hypothetical protein
LKRNQKNIPPPIDTPASRKRRLQKRLQEINARSEQELANIMKSIEQIKSQFKSNK